MSYASRTVLDMVHEDVQLVSVLRALSAGLSSGILADFHVHIAI